VGGGMELAAGWRVGDDEGKEENRGLFMSVIDGKFGTGFFGCMCRYCCCFWFVLRLSYQYFLDWIFLDTGRGGERGVG